MAVQSSIDFAANKVSQRKCHPAHCRTYDFSPPPAVLWQQYSCCKYNNRKSSCHCASAMQHTSNLLFLAHASSSSSAMTSCCAQVTVLRQQQCKTVQQIIARLGQYPYDQAPNAMQFERCENDSQCVRSEQLQCCCAHPTVTAHILCAAHTTRARTHLQQHLETFQLSNVQCAWGVSHTARAKLPLSVSSTLTWSELQGHQVSIDFSALRHAAARKEHTTTTLILIMRHMRAAHCRHVTQE